MSPKGRGGMEYGGFKSQMRKNSIFEFRFTNSRDFDKHGKIKNPPLQFPYTSTPLLIYNLANEYLSRPDVNF